MQPGEDFNSNQTPQNPQQPNIPNDQGGFNNPRPLGPGNQPNPNFPAPNENQPTPQLPNPLNPQPPKPIDITPPQAFNQPNTFSQSQPSNLKPIPQERKVQLPSETITATNSEKTAHPTGKKIGIAFLIIIILLIIAGAYWYFLAKKFVTINANPADSEVKIDEQAVAVNKKIAVKAGNHILKISRSGYVEYEKQITVEKQTINKVFQIELKKVPSPVQVFDNECLKIVQNADGIFCLSDEGKTLYRIADGSGKETNKAITPKTLAGIERIIMNPKNSLAIIKIKASKSELENSPFVNRQDFSETEGTWLYDFNRYNIVDQEATYWNNKIYDAVWTPDGESVYYVKTENNATSLVKAGKNNQNPEVVLNLTAQKIENPKLTMSSDGKTIAMIPRSKNYAKNYVYYYDTYSKTAQVSTKTGNTLGSLFSPDGKSLAFTTYKANSSNSKAFSELYLKSGDNEQTTSILAFIENLIWQNNQNMIILTSASASETLKMINLNTQSLEKTNLVWEEGSITQINSFLLSADNSKIYYISNNNLLYSIEIVLNKYIE